jgi:ABC-type dipeptide/oligopeptide/nickel transport system permease component
MPSFLKFLFQRILSAILTLFIITVVLYGVIALAPLDMRLSLYLPKNINARIASDEVLWQQVKNQIIEKYHLSDSFPIQYATWVKTFFTQNWGYSISLKDEVLNVILNRMPATIELAFYSLLLLIPLSLLSGILAANQEHRTADRLIRSISTLTTSIPTFILALFLLAVFYVGLGWFSPNRISQSISLELSTLSSFKSFTGFLTVDGLLNLRPDICLDAFRHLVLPVSTLSLGYWAVLTRLTRIGMIEELKKDYITAAKARGLPPRLILWKHTLRNILPPFLTNTALTAAAIVSGVFVVERIYLWPGISSMIMRDGFFQPDPAAVLGFVIYSVIMVLALMFILDLLQAFINPLTSIEVQPNE